MKAIEPAREAVRLLTVVPVGSSAEPAAPAAAVAWYAPVGLAMGGALALAAFVAWEAFPAMLAAVAVVACWAALTGMLHLDGLADTADAALAPVSRERRLVIARDVAHGTFAVVAVALVLAMKAAALAGMPRDAAAAMVLLEACVRLLPGVLGNETSTVEESFSDGLLEHPQYTRPREWEGRTIPDVLTSGDHAKVEAWRRAERERLTAQRRPDLKRTRD